jgi:hypothetical protein
MRTHVGTEAEAEIIRFLASQPSAEQIIAFHSSSEVADRAYELIDIERERQLTEEEQKEMDTFLYLEHFMQMLKIEARRQLQQRTA